jgi:hypothetical protein
VIPRTLRGDSPDRDPIPVRYFFAFNPKPNPKTMKTTIDNKTYNTATATKVAEASNHAPANDFHAWWETLYLTQKGNWFLHGEGGPMTIYATEHHNRSTDGERIIPMSREQALAWCAKHNAQEAIDNHFGELVEEA